LVLTYTTFIKGYLL